MNCSIPWKPTAGVILFLAVSSALARPDSFRGRCHSLGPVEVLAAAPDQPRTEASAQPTIPAALEPPEGHVLLFTFRAEGVQVYECKPSENDPTKFEWASQGPDATLFDDRGEKAGTHTSGPTWEATDGSKVVAVKKAASPAPGGRAIPWLLLEVKSHEGAGVFSKLTYIQRVETWAGLPPAEGTNKENAGKQMRVKYEATYRFYGAAP
jgi:hypothetical protein